MEQATRTSLAVFDALGRLGVAADLMELDGTDPRVRGWQEGLVRLALEQGRNLPAEDRKALEEFLEGGGRDMEQKKKRLFWGWQWAYGLGCHTELSDGDLMPCGKLVSFASKAERDSWVKAGRWREKRSRGEALKLIRRGWTGDDFDWEVLLREQDLERRLTDKELVELWRASH